MIVYYDEAEDQLVTADGEIIEGAIFQDRIVHEDIVQVRCVVLAKPLPARSEILDGASRLLKILEASDVPS